MLIDAGRGGSPGPDEPEEIDPDEERERRWEPMSLRIVLSAAGSLSCIWGSAATPPEVAVLLHVVAFFLLWCFIRAVRADQRRRAPG